MIENGITLAELFEDERFGGAVNHKTWKKCDDGDRCKITITWEGKIHYIITSDNMSKYTKEGDKIDFNTRVNWVGEFNGIEINKFFAFKKLIFIDRETILKELGLAA